MSGYNMAGHWTGSTDCWLLPGLKQIWGKHGPPGSRSSDSTPATGHETRQHGFFLNVDQNNNGLLYFQ